MLIIYSIIRIIFFVFFFFFFLFWIFFCPNFLFFKNTSARKKVKIILLPIANILNTGHREHTKMEPGHTCLSSKNNRNNNNNNINNCNAGPYSIGLWHTIWPLFNLYAKAVMSGTRFHHLQIYSYCNLSHIYTQSD